MVEYRIELLDQQRNKLIAELGKLKAKQQKFNDILNTPIRLGVYYNPEFDAISYFVGPGIFYRGWASDNGDVRVTVLESMDGYVWIGEFD